VRDYCNITDALPELFVTFASVLNNAQTAACAVDEPWLSTYLGSVTYTVPRIDVLVSAVVRSQPEALLTNMANLTAQWQVPNSVIIAALGHSHPSLSPTGITVVPLGHNDRRIYSGERRTQVDMRFAKLVRFGRTRTDIGVDLYNLLNTNYTNTFNTTYSYTLDTAPRAAGWGTPNGIINPRFVRVNFTVNF
jgi:hypothetical protein